MLEMFIIRNEKDKEECQGEGGANNAKVKKGGRGETHFVFFFGFFE